MTMKFSWVFLLRIGKGEMWRRDIHVGYTARITSI